jgi:predicted metal-dependent hydrolase
MTERSQIQFGQTTIAFVIRRADAETPVAVSIEGRGQLVVTAPEGVKLQKLHDLVRHRAPWVLKRVVPRKVRESPAPPSDRNFETGESVLYLGGRYRLRVVESSDPEESRISAGWYEIPVTPGLDGDARRLEVRRHLIGSLKEHADLYLPTKLAHVCRMLLVEEPSLVVCAPRKRWGSIDRDGVLRLNWRLVQAHTDLIECFLTDELARVGDRMHDETYWRTVALWAHNHDERRTRLRELGPSLVW